MWTIRTNSKSCTEAMPRAPNQKSASKCLLQIPRARRGENQLCAAANGIWMYNRCCSSKVFSTFNNPNVKKTGFDMVYKFFMKPSSASNTPGTWFLTFHITTSLCSTEQTKCSEDFLTDGAVSAHDMRWNDSEQNLTFKVNIFNVYYVSVLHHCMWLLHTKWVWLPWSILIPCRFGVCVILSSISIFLWTSFVT